MKGSFRVKFSHVRSKQTEQNLTKKKMLQELARRCKGKNEDSIFVDVKGGFFRESGRMAIKVANHEGGDHRLTSKTPRNIVRERDFFYRRRRFSTLKKNADKASEGLKGGRGSNPS